jgi:hypothetical protein
MLDACRPIPSPDSSSAVAAAFLPYTSPPLPPTPPPSSLRLDGSGALPLSSCANAAASYGSSETRADRAWSGHPLRSASSARQCGGSWCAAPLF